MRFGQALNVRPSFMRMLFPVSCRMILSSHLELVSAEALPRVIQKALIRSPVLCSTLPAWHGALFAFGAFLWVSVSTRRWHERTTGFRARL